MIQMAAVMMFTDWIRADIGGGVMRLNSYIPAIPLIQGAGHALPPNVALITDPFRPGDIDSDRCAESEAPRHYPAIYVQPDGPVPSEGEVGTIFRDGKVAFCARYIVKKGNAARSAVQAAYTMKALERAAVDFFNDDVTGRTARGCEVDTDGRVAILYCELKDGLAYGPWYEEIGDAVANQIMSFDITVRDWSP